MPDDLGIPPDLRAATERMRQFAEQTERRAAQFRQAGERAEQATVTEQSTDGSITVRVAASGALTDLRLTNRIRKQDASQTAAQIMRLVQRAQAGIAERVRDIVEETVSDDSDLSRQLATRVVDSFRQRFPGGADRPAESPRRDDDDHDDWNERSIFDEPPKPWRR